MGLDNYFQKLIEKVERSDIQNNGTDKNGFFEPTRAVLLQKLHILKDLHGKKNPQARTMVHAAWEYVTEKLPPEWLVLTEEQKAELREILSDTQ